MAVSRGGSRWHGSRLTVGMLKATGMVAGLASLASFAGRIWWGFDVSSHLRVQYCLSLGSLAAIFGAMRRVRPALFFGALSLLNLGTILPMYLGKRTARAITGLRALLINVNERNRRYDLVLQYIADADPDLVLLEEVNTDWLTALAPLAGRYPHTELCARDDTYGIALYSKHPLLESRIIYCGKAALPSIVSRIAVHNREITLVGTHPLPPLTALHTRRRNEQLIALARVIAKLPRPLVLMGDLNVSKWSFYYQRFVRKCRLYDSGKGHGFHPTWPRWIVPLLTELDHCLLSHDLHVLTQQVGNNVGSDHYPLLVEFAFA